MSFNIILDKEFEFVRKNRKIVSEDNEKIVFEDGEIYHKSNRLNELTNKEWLKFQKSWFILNPAPRTEDVLLHPAKFPEELVSEFIKFFTKSGDVVLDPMVGTGSALIAAIENGMSAIGIELLEKYALIAKKRVEHIISQMSLTKFLNSKSNNVKKLFVKIIVGDARDIDKMNLPQIDYCITSPPYWDMLTEEGFETQKEREEMGLDVYYSDDPRDLGNIHDYEKFLDELESIYKKVYDILKPGKYMTIIIKNVKKGDRMFPLAWDLAKRLSKFFVLKDEKIWCQDNISLAPFGYRYSWVSNTVHHYCLNFQKK
jgi:DNA modification methylase